MYVRKTKGSVAERIIEALTEEIIAGRIRPGDKLPTEMELCEQYGAGRNSVREAIKQLQANGVVYIKRAEGTYLAESYSQKLLDPMLYSIILKENSWRDFVELRSVIDIGIMHVLIGRENAAEAFPDLLRMLEKMDEELHREEPSEDLVMELDTGFHSRLAEISGNPQLMTIMSYITRLTVPSRRETLRKVIEGGEVDRFVTLHRQWLEVLEKKQADRIDQTVQEHYIFWKG